MQRDEISAWMTLIRAAGIGSAAIHILVQRFGTAAATISAPHHELADHGLEPGNVLSIYHSGPEIRDNVGNIRPSKVKIPDTHIGELMIFRAYDKLSYALIMHSTDVVSVMDVVRNPG